MKKKIKTSLAASLLFALQVNAAESVNVEQSAETPFKQAVENLEFQKNLSADFAGNIDQSSLNSVTVQEREWQGEVTTVPVLTILVEFPDALHNSIKPPVTGHYFDDYSPEHYRRVIYSENGYRGPAPEFDSLPSKRKYILDQSGGSFDIRGDVFGWYTAEHDYRYYGEATAMTKDINPRALVIEAVEHVLGDPGFNLSDYDADSDGVIDHLSIIHSTLGQESGSVMYADYIWSHRSTVYQTVTNDSTLQSATIGSYIMQPISAAAGVLAHEFGHDLGLPDEYDIKGTADKYSRPGSTVGNWSMMAGGSWVGKIAGTKPSGYSPFAKLLLQNKYGGNWVQSTEIDASDLNADGTILKLHQAATKGQFNDLVKVNLPEQTVQNFTPLKSKAILMESDGFGVTSRAINLTQSINPKITVDLNMKKSFNSSWGFRVGVYDPALGGTVFITPEPNADVSISGEKVTGTAASWQTVTYDLSAFKHCSYATLVFQNYNLNTARGHVAFDNVIFKVSPSLLCILSF